MFCFMSPIMEEIGNRKTHLQNRGAISDHTVSPAPYLVTCLAYHKWKTHVTRVAAVLTNLCYIYIV